MMNGNLTMMDATMLDVRVIDVTPEIAGNWLRTQEDHRRIRKHVVDKYARDMAAGRWILTGEPIILDNTDALLDGSYRLWACIACATPFRAVVVRGIDPHGRWQMGQGQTRTAAEAMRFAGLDGGLATPSKWYERVTRDVRRRKLLSAAEVRDVLERHAQALTEASVLLSSDPWVLKHAKWVGVLARMLELDRDAALTFHAQMSTGADLAAGSPALALRNAVFKHDAGRHRDRRPSWYTAALAIKAWNAHLAGRKIRRLEIKKTEVIAWA